MPGCRTHTSINWGFHVGAVLVIRDVDDDDELVVASNFEVNSFVTRGRGFVGLLFLRGTLGVLPSNADRSRSSRKKGFVAVGGSTDDLRVVGSIV